MDISVKEMVPVTIAAALWGPQWSTDNMAVMASLQQRRPGKSPPLMHLMHCIYISSVSLRILFSARHVPGVLNEVTNALSDHVSSLI